MIGLLDIQHPEYHSLSREDKLSKIIAFFELADAIPLPEGTRFEGVFVDRDGTLYDVEKKEFKQETLDLVKKYLTEGKEVTVRTLWDVKKIQALLDEAGIALKVKSKADLEGGTVEIAIDDL